MYEAAMRREKRLFQVLRYELLCSCGQLTMTGVVIYDDQSFIVRVTPICATCISVMRSAGANMWVDEMPDTDPTLKVARVKKEVTQWTS